MKPPRDILKYLIPTYYEYINSPCKRKLEFYGSAHLPLICAGESQFSCPSDGCVYICTYFKNTFWHSHPKTKYFNDDINLWLSPNDAICLCTFKHTTTYLFTETGIYRFKLPRRSPYVIQDWVESEFQKEFSKKKSNKIKKINKKKIMCPISNKRFCKKFNITRKLIYKYNTKEHQLYINNDEFEVDIE